MEPYVTGAIVFAVFLVGVLAVQLALHTSRWRRAATRTDGDYREAPRVTEGAVAIRWDVVAISVVSTLWAVCTYVFVAAGALLALMTLDDSGDRAFAVFLVPLLGSGVAHASFAIRASSRLVRRHAETARTATRSAIHGVIHHAAVLTLFLTWAASASSHDFEEAALMLTPICAFGALVSGAVHVAGRRAAVRGGAADATERPSGGLAPIGPAW